MHPAKIPRFPRHIREELNQRLDQSEKTKSTLAWLNSLPEVQAVLAAEFKGERVKRQNLDSWKQSGFKTWRITQSALDFTENSLPDDLDQSVLEKMSAKLIRCLQIRYAAVAGSLPAVQDNPELELRRLGDLCNNLTALRRGDLAAERLSVEQQRLALEKSRSGAEVEKLFWEWTKRPDIQEKLYPHRDPEQTRREVERLVNRQLLGIDKPAPELELAIDPAVLI
jgi:hypothetical protein